MRKKDLVAFVLKKKNRFKAELEALKNMLYAGLIGVGIGMMHECYLSNIYNH